MPSSGSRPLWFALLCALTLVASACDDEAPEGCAKGRIVECPCPDENTGTQTCLDDRSFGPCLCPGDPPMEDAGPDAAHDAGPDAMPPVEDIGPLPDSMPVPDGGPEADAAPEPDAGPVPVTTQWLRTEGNQFLTEDGEAWVGRGVNIQDTRGCDQCTFQAPHVNEVIRRIDEAVDVWGANFIRLYLESYAEDGGRTQWQTLLEDDRYLEDILTIVDHVGTKVGVYLLVSMGQDPGVDALGWPTIRSREIIERLVQTLYGRPWVMFGVANEPHSNRRGSLDGEVRRAMNQAADMVRSTESILGQDRHIIVVPGTRQDALDISHYVANPIDAGGGVNVAYEAHIFGRPEELEDLLAPADSIPMIMGEFGPEPGVTPLEDVEAVIAAMEARSISWTAWTFFNGCPPNLLQGPVSCDGEGLNFEPTAWGRVVMTALEANDGPTP